MRCRYDGDRLGEIRTKRFSADIIKRRAVAFERFARWQAQAPTGMAMSSLGSRGGCLRSILANDSACGHTDTVPVIGVYQCRIGENVTGTFL